MPRDTRIDAVRGIALLVIFITHMPGNALARFMPHSFGFSDAAEVFVLLAGVSAVLAYGTLIDQRGLAVGGLRIGARVWTLYAAHICLFVIVCGVVGIAVERTSNPLYIETINIQPFLDNTLHAIMDVLRLTYQPNFLDILPLYIVLLTAFPLIYRLARLSPVATLVASAALWQGAVALELNLPNTGAAVWFFNPFAWQFVFTLGTVIGLALRAGLATPGGRPARLADVAALTVLGLSCIIKVSSGNPLRIDALNDWVEALQLGTDKTNLAPIRVLHMASAVWLFCRLVPRTSLLFSNPVGRNLAMMGRHSLEVFCVGTVLSIVGQVIIAETSFALEAQLLVCAAGVTILCSLGNFLTWYRSIALKNPSSVAPPLHAASASQR